MLINSKDNSDYVFEKYKGYIIASHKNNVAEKDMNNLIIVYRPDEFPDYGYIIGLDDSKIHGNRKSFPHNIGDAKAHIDWVLKTRQERNKKKVEISKPRKNRGRRM